MCAWFPGPLPVYYHQIFAGKEILLQLRMHVNFFFSSMEKIDRVKLSLKIFVWSPLLNFAAWYIIMKWTWIQSIILPLFCFGLYSKTSLWEAYFSSRSVSKVAQTEIWKSSWVLLMLGARTSRTNKASLVSYKFTRNSDLKARNVNVQFTGYLHAFNFIHKK